MSASLLTVTALWLAGQPLASMAAADQACQDRKHHPGHYVSLRRKDTRELFAELTLPGVAGVQKRYYWKEFESGEGVYDFAQLQADLDAAGEAGLQLVAMIEDKSFDGELPTPGYLQEKYTARNRNRGYTAIRWDPYVQARFSALLAAVGARFDCHPSFEGVAIQESSLSLDNEALKAHGYKPALYRDSLQSVLLSATAAMPNSNVFWYMNFFPGRQQYLGELADAVAGKVVIGGPDVLPNNASLKRHTYPIYRSLAGRTTLFNSMQNDSYAHRRGGDDNGEYWTLDELFLFARDELHVSYLFWNRKDWRRAGEPFDWDDAKQVIARHAGFGRDDVTAEAH
jgi:hypothetical protein